MGELPYLKVYIGDWRKDPGVQKSSMQTRGIWFELMLCMHEIRPRGTITGTLHQLCRMIGATKREMRSSLHEIRDQNIGTVSVVNGVYTIVNRRMVRDDARRIREKEDKQQQRDKARTTAGQQPDNSRTTAGQQPDNSRTTAGQGGGCPPDVRDLSGAMSGKCPSHSYEDKSLSVSLSEEKEKALSHERTKKKKFSVELTEQFERDFWDPYLPKVEKQETARRFHALSQQDRDDCCIAVKQYMNSARIRKHRIQPKDPKRFILDGKGNELWREWVNPAEAEVSDEYADETPAAKRLRELEANDDGT